MRSTTRATSSPGRARPRPAGRVAAVLLAALLFAAPVAARGEEVSVASVVLFNTECARCHEGQCSGRLSFLLSPDATDEHIQRYAGSLDAPRLLELYEVLRHMKESCAFYPLPFALARDRVWSAEALKRFQGPSGKVYFIPLGRLPAGSHRLLIEGLAPDAPPCVELIDNGFETLDQTNLEPDDDGGWRLRFRSEGAAAVFLRLRSPVADGLTRIEIAADD